MALTVLTSTCFFMYRFYARFRSPTSMTAQLECAMLFISERNGIILEIKKDPSSNIYQQYFNVSYLSFGTEDERLWFGGFRALRFSSIRVLNNFNKWKNFKLFIPTLTVFHKIITGKYNSNKYGGDSVSKRDEYIMNELINKLLLNKENEFSFYVNKLFESFTKTRKTITIDIYRQEDTTFFPFSSEYYRKLFFYQQTTGMFCICTNLAEIQL